MIRTGTDIVEVDRVRKIINLYGNKLSKVNHLFNRVQS